MGSPVPPCVHQLLGAPPPVKMSHVTLGEDTGGKSLHIWHYGQVDDKNFQVHGRSLLVVVAIFSLVLFLAVVYLYARWACRYRRMVVTISSTAGNGSEGATAHQDGGLDKVTIERLPVRLHHAVVEVGEDAQCPICLSGLVDGEKVKVMPGCEHGFHPECVDPWLRYHPTCPLCRASLATTSPAADPPGTLV